MNSERAAANARPLADTLVQAPSRLIKKLSYISEEFYISPLPLTALEPSPPEVASDAREVRYVMIFIGPLLNLKS